jgi:hypothetical protein
MLVNSMGIDSTTIDVFVGSDSSAAQTVSFQHRLLILPDRHPPPINRWKPTPGGRAKERRPKNPAARPTRPYTR